MSSKVLTTTEAARVLGLTHRGVQSAVQRARMHAEKRGGRWFIAIAEVERYRAFHMHAQADEKALSNKSTRPARHGAGRRNKAVTK